MRKSGGVSGAVSLVMIFCVLCLAVFSALALVTADRESGLTEMAARSAEEYYRADHDAIRVAAALQRGASLPEDLDTEIVWDGDTASFLLPIGDSQGLDVAVSIGDGEPRIIRWRTIYIGSWEPDGLLTLWDGT